MCNEQPSFVGGVSSVWVLVKVLGVSDFSNFTLFLHAQTKGDKWSFPKQKVAQWAHASHVGVEKCSVKYTVDFWYVLTVCVRPTPPNIVIKSWIL